MIVITAVLVLHVVVWCCTPDASAWGRCVHELTVTASFMTRVSARTASAAGSRWAGFSRFQTSYILRRKFFARLKIVWSLLDRYHDIEARRVSQPGPPGLSQSIKTDWERVADRFSNSSSRIPSVTGNPVVSKHWEANPIIIIALLNYFLII